MMDKKKFGVIFDLDGVIIDSSEVMRAAFSYAFKQFFPDKEVPFSEFIKHMGKGFLTIMDEMHLPRELSSFFSDKSIELTSKIEVFPGMEIILKGFRRSEIYVGIATGKDSYRTSLILEQKKLSSYFDHVVCADEVNQGKPHPDSAYYHMEKSGLHERQFVFVGDSISDIQCAHNADMLSIAVLWGMGSRAELLREKPSYLTYEIDDLSHIFSQSGFLND